MTTEGPSRTDRLFFAERPISSVSTVTNLHKRVQTNTLLDCFYSSGMDKSPGALAGGSLSVGQIPNGKGLNLVLKPDSVNPPDLCFNHISPYP